MCKRLTTRTNDVLDYATSTIYQHKVTTSGGLTYKINLLGVDKPLTSWNDFSRQFVNGLFVSGVKGNGDGQILFITSSNQLWYLSKTGSNSYDAPNNPSFATIESDVVTIV